MGWQLIGLATLGAAAGMALLWAIGRRIGNMAVVDFGWAAEIGLCGALYAALGPAPAARRAIVAAMAAAWSGRLSLHLLRDRVIGHAEEGRYRELRARWAPHAGAAFFVFFQAQAALAVLLSTPFFLAVHRRAAALHPFELVAPALLAVAVIGEGFADSQLRRFKAEPGSRGKTCRRGLWRYSRHPNYFFEWLVWWAFALLALPAPHGYLALGCPMLMLYLLLRVTGIPATEAQALRSRGDDYRDYQRTTSAFFPWFRRAAAAAGAAEPGAASGPRP